jgi:hypothetical protein
VVEGRDHEGHRDHDPRPVDRRPDRGQLGWCVTDPLDELLPEVRSSQQQRHQDDADEQAAERDPEAEEAVLPPLAQPVAVVGDGEGGEHHADGSGRRPHGGHEGERREGDVPTLDELDEQWPQAFDGRRGERDAADLEGPVDELLLPVRVPQAPGDGGDGDGGQQQRGQRQQHPEGDLGREARQPVAHRAVECPHDEAHARAEALRGALDQPERQRVHHVEGTWRAAWEDGPPTGRRGGRYSGPRIAGSGRCCYPLARRERYHVRGRLEASPSLVYGAGLLIPLGLSGPRGFKSLSLRGTTRTTCAGSSVRIEHLTTDQAAGGSNPSQRATRERPATHL